MTTKENNNDTCISIPCHSRAQTRETRNMDTIPLDTRVKHEYDTERVQKYENDNLEFSSCHSRAQTRESRNIDFSSDRYPRVKSGGPLDIAGYLCRNMNMTKGNNFINKDIIQLDTRVKHEYDTE